MKPAIKFIIGNMVLLLIMVVSCQYLLAQPAVIPHHTVSNFVLSSAQQDAEAGEDTVFIQTVQVNGVPWLQLHFGTYNLGSNSYLVITSVLDGAQQILTDSSLPQWGNRSAYFNGDTVELALHVATDETDIFYNVEEVTVGEWETGDTIESICGTADNRVSSTDPREGRIVPIGCTGWIVSNGAFLTAGHCTGTSMTTLEFNVPASLSNGTIQHPAPQDQYPIIASSVVFQDDGYRPHGCFKQHAFTVCADSNCVPSGLRIITGYNTDGSTGGNCSDCFCDCVVRPENRTGF